MTYITDNELYAGCANCFAVQSRGGVLFMSRSAGERDENPACGQIAVVIENPNHNRKRKNQNSF
jgi:hypothetical protein